VLGNLAQGGGGAGAGSGSGGAGGTGAGGAAYNDAGSSLYLSHGCLTLNAALGGQGGAGGSSGAGGAGLGGAINNAGPNALLGPNLPGGALFLTDTLVIVNFAQGGDAGSGVPSGSSGQGIGGGLYLATGSTTTLIRTIVKLNFASTSNHDIYGSYNS
jgi:hypothetical protein